MTDRRPRGPSAAPGGHTEFPDEEGTEIRCLTIADRRLPIVTPNSPMRRGLKLKFVPGYSPVDYGHTEFPDEEGTEMHNGALTLRRWDESHRIPR